MPGSDYRPPPQPKPVRRGRKGAFRNQQDAEFQEQPQNKTNAPAGVDMSEAERLYRDSVRAELEKHRLLMEQIQRERANLNPVNLRSQQQAGRPAAKTKININIDTKQYPENRPSGSGRTGISTAASSGQQQPSKPAPPANSQAGVIEPLYATKKTFKNLPKDKALPMRKSLDEIPGVKLDPSRKVRGIRKAKDDVKNISEVQQRAAPNASKATPTTITQTAKKRQELEAVSGTAMKKPRMGDVAKALVENTPAMKAATPPQTTSKAASTPIPETTKKGLIRKQDRPSSSSIGKGQGGTPAPTAAPASGKGRGRPKKKKDPEPEVEITSPPNPPNPPPPPPKRKTPTKEVRPRAKARADSGAAVDPPNPTSPPPAEEATPKAKAKAKPKIRMTTTNAPPAATDKVTGKPKPPSQLRMPTLRAALAAAIKQTS
jgi:hypothetical protein